jgi:hypothetical protein
MSFKLNEASGCAQSDDQLKWIIRPIDTIGYRQLELIEPIRPLIVGPINGAAHGRQLAARVTFQPTPSLKPDGYALSTFNSRLSLFSFQLFSPPHKKIPRRYILLGGMPPWEGGAPLLQPTDNWNLNAGK